MDKLVWIVLVLLAGALLPVQAGLNARMGKAIANPVWASLISFAVGLIALLVFIAVTQQKLNISSMAAVPKIYWIAGVLGAFYVTVMVLAFPRIGAALTFGLIVAGQLSISLLLDHYKILVPQQHSINIYRILGLVLIIAGVILIRKF